MPGISPRASPATTHTPLLAPVPLLAPIPLPSPPLLLSLFPFSRLSSWFRILTLEALPHKWPRSCTAASIGDTSTSPSASSPDRCFPHDQPQQRCHVHSYVYNYANCPLAHCWSFPAAMTHGRKVALGDYTRPSVQRQLHLRDLLVHILHKLDDKVDKLVLQHGLSVEVGDQERDVVALQSAPGERRALSIRLTGIGFLLRITKPSARIIMNLVNLWHRIFSISSACLIAMLSRMELTDGSIRTRSDSFRETITGWRTASMVLLRSALTRLGQARRPGSTHPASISGLL